MDQPQQAASSAAFSSCEPSSPEKTASPPQQELPPPPSAKLLIMLRDVVDALKEHSRGRVEQFRAIVTAQELWRLDEFVNGDCDAAIWAASLDEAAAAGAAAGTNSSSSPSSARSTFAFNDECLTFAAFSPLPTPRETLKIVAAALLGHPYLDDLCQLKQSKLPTPQQAHEEGDAATLAPAPANQTAVIGTPLPASPASQPPAPKKRKRSHSNAFELNLVLSPDLTDCRGKNLEDQSNALARQEGGGAGGTSLATGVAAARTPDLPPEPDCSATPGVKQLWAEHGLFGKTIFRFRPPSAAGASSSAAGVRPLEPESGKGGRVRNLISRFEALTPQRAVDVSKAENNSALIAAKTPPPVPKAPDPPPVSQTPPGNPPEPKQQQSPSQPDTGSPTVSVPVLAKGRHSYTGDASRVGPGRALGAPLIVIQGSVVTGERQPASEIDWSGGGAAVLPIKFKTATTGNSASRFGPAQNSKISTILEAEDEECNSSAAASIANELPTYKHDPESSLETAKDDLVEHTPGMQEDEEELPPPPDATLRKLSVSDDIQSLGVGSGLSSDGSEDRAERSGRASSSVIFAVEKENLPAPAPTNNNLLLNQPSNPPNHALSYGPGGTLIGPTVGQNSQPSSSIPRGPSCKVIGTPSREVGKGVGVCRPRRHRELKAIGDKNLDDQADLSDDEGQPKRTKKTAASWARKTADWHLVVRQQSCIDPISIFGCGVREVKFEEIFRTPDFHRAAKELGRTSNRNKTNNNYGGGAGAADFASRESRAIKLKKWHQDKKQCGFGEHEGMSLTDVLKFREKMQRTVDVSDMVWDSKWVQCTAECNHNSATRQPWFQKESLEGLENVSPDCTSPLVSTGGSVKFKRTLGSPLPVARCLYEEESIDDDLNSPTPQTVTRGIFCSIANPTRLL